MTVMSNQAPDTLDHGDHWRDRAACKADPEAMFPGTDPRDIEHARSFCHACPVREACLVDAMRAERRASRHNRYGMRAALTPSQRARLYQQDPHWRDVALGTT